MLIPQQRQAFFVICNLNMKLQTALKILQRQLLQIETIQKGDNSWVLQTQEYIKKFFGEQTILLSFFNNFNAFIL